MARLAVLVGVALLASHAHAITKAYSTTALRTLSDAAHYGGCMAMLAKAPVDEGLNCTGPWVTFSCTGDFADKDAANRNFEATQIAMLTERSIIVYVDDTKKHNGYCFARRVDLLNQ